jgi:hypothetical protein
MFENGLAHVQAMPDWLWASFEHVNLPGRCDFNGCNASFGYLNANAPEGTYQNCVRPHSIPDELFGARWG